MAHKIGILAAALLVAACGGSGPATQGPGATAPGGGSTETSGPGATGPASGGAAVVDPCSLLSVGEAAGAIDTAELTSAGTPGDPATCTYSLEGFGEVLTVSVLRNGAAAQYQTFVDAGSGEAVSGVGEAALFERSSRRLVFRAGDAFVMLFSRYVGGADAALVAYTKAGTIVAARLTGAALPPEAQLTAPPVLSAATACDLLPTDEAATVIGRGPMTAEGSSAQFCLYALAAGGEVIFGTYLDPKGGQAAWDEFAASLTVDEVADLGERAMFEPSTGILFVLQGDAILNVNVYGVDSSVALAQDRALMEQMLGNL